MVGGFEVFIGKNARYQVLRCFQLPNYYPTKDRVNQFKVQIEPPHGGEAYLDIYDVPTEVFMKYQKLRIKLGREAVEQYERVIREIMTEIENTVNSNDWLPVNEASQLLGMKPQSLVKSFKGIFRMTTYNNMIYVNKDDVEEYLRHYGKKKKIT